MKTEKETGTSQGIGWGYIICGKMSAAESLPFESEAERQREREKETR